jgi:polyphosphate kinase
VAFVLDSRSERNERQHRSDSIVDNYLEHSRIYIFGNAGQTEVYISSADFMTRNLDGRVEVTCPIYDQNIKQELIDNFDLGWKGNVKARYHWIN